MTAFAIIAAAGLATIYATNKDADGIEKGTNLAAAAVWFTTSVVSFFA